MAATAMETDKQNKEVNCENVAYGLLLMITVRNRYFKYKEQYENSYFENIFDKELACKV